MPPLPPASFAPPAPAAPEIPGLISSVPGISRPAATPPTTAPTTPPTMSAPSPGLVDRVPASVRPIPAPGADASSDDDEDPGDVERTRMVPDRGVPEESTPRGTGLEPSAMLHLWDGRRLTLTGTALIGRNPMARDGEPEPTHRLTLDDPTRSVSKTHLQVGVDDVGVWVKDRGSTNGTVASWEGARIQCPAHELTRVPLGARVAFGRYWFTVA